MAEELKLGKPVTPEYFDEVTIYFSEIMAFIDLASESTPMEVRRLKLQFSLRTVIHFFDLILVLRICYFIRTKVLIVDDCPPG